MVSVKVYLAVTVMAVLASVFGTADGSYRKLADPIPALCKTRVKDFKQGDHWYHLATGRDLAADKAAGFEEEKKPVDTREDKEAKPEGLADRIVRNWLGARNHCRRRCMETVSLQTQQEFDKLVNYIRHHEIEYIWTSGRLCDFAGCSERFVEPQRENAWFWLGTNSKLPNTNIIPAGWTKNPWSLGGYEGDAQPDNIEFGYTSTTENCIGINNDRYDDGINLHDLACYHKLHVLCEDSDLLFSYVRQSYGIKLE